MNKKQEIEEIFSIFHDGFIEEAKITNDTIELKIGIQYIAELIQKNHEFLYLTLFGVKSVEFHAWANTTLVIADWKSIFGLGIEILSTELDESGKIIVHSNCEFAPEEKFNGGKLIIDCTDYKISDENKDELNLEKLKKLTTSYWNDLHGKSN